MRHDVCRNLDSLEDLVVALKDLDRVPALLLFGLVVDDSLFDVRNRMLDRTGERVHRDGLRALCRADCRLGSFHDAGALQRGDLDDLAAQLTAQLGGVDLVAVLADDVHHVDGDDDRNAQLGQLRGQVQVTLQICAVDDVQNRIGALGNQIVTCNDFFQRIRGKGVDAGKVHDDDVVMLLLLNRNAGPVADILVGAGQRIEQRCFAAVRVARKGNFDLLFHVTSPPCFSSLIEIRVIKQAFKKIKYDVITEPQSFPYPLCGAKAHSRGP